MDSEFLQQLDKALSYVGTDKVWMRTIGGREIKFSPIPVPGQEKVNETLNQSELGSNIILESKRVTLSFGIVGIDGIDLVEYRNAGPIFSSTSRDGKPVKVTLDRYIYDKIKTWGGQFLDDVFTVYADLLESHQKDNLKDIKFENAKDPEVELLELEARVTELRKMLNKPPLIDADKQSEPVNEEPLEESPIQEEFNPFATVPIEETKEAILPPSSVHLPPPPAPTSPEKAEVRPLASRESPAVSRPAISRIMDLDNSNPVTSPTSPYVPRQVDGDVIEERSSRKPLPPPQIDAVNTSINPRFKR
jgi:hypothetical protein